MSTLLRLVDDIIDQQNVFNEPDLLVTMEYFHAFDCISKEVMVTAFENFGFGVGFVN